MTVVSYRLQVDCLDLQGNPLRGVRVSVAVAPQTLQERPDPDDAGEEKFVFPLPPAPVLTGADGSASLQLIPSFSDRHYLATLTGPGGRSFQRSFRMPAQDSRLADLPEA